MDYRWGGGCEWAGRSSTGLRWAGGAIITWQDYRNGNCDIYAQAIDSTGAIKWTPNGVAICTAANVQDAPQLVSDGQRGAVITWNDNRNGNSDIYAQAIDSTGAVEWTPNGVAICTAANNQYAPLLVTDGQGGAIITWYDYRNGNWDIYAQAVNSTGAVKWTTNGIAICTDANDQYAPRLVSDRQGGAIITWMDSRNGNSDIYAQVVDNTGVVKWTTDGVAICTDPNDQYPLQLASDGQGGAIIAWIDNRNSNGDIYAQAIDSTGAVKWTTDGVAICTDAYEQASPQLVSDGQGGAIITWVDSRNGNSDIYAQAVDSTGAVKWTTDGVAICTAANDQYNQQLITDGQGGAIIAWKDYRNGNSDIYAQSVFESGFLVPVELSDFITE